MFKNSNDLQYDGCNGEVAFAVHGGHNAEDSIKKKSRNAQKKQQIVEQRHCVPIDVESSHLSVGDAHGHRHQNQKSQLCDGVDEEAGGDERLISHRHEE